MVDSWSGQLPREATLIVDDRLAAVQLEACLLRERDRDGRGAWTSPDIRTHGSWAAAAWRAQPDPGRLPLSAAQSAALWRRVVASSDDGGTLMHTAQLASWAADAWRLLLGWRLDFRELRARQDDLGFASFLRWAAQYYALLLDGGWMDGAELDAALCKSGVAFGSTARPLIWADTRLATPALVELVSRAAAAGIDAGFWRPPREESVPRSVAAADPREELRAAVGWARARIADDLRARIALVVPSESDNDLVLERCADVGEAVPVRLAGRPADREPVIGAALDILGLFGCDAEFRSLSRVLRSPFLGDALESRAARGVVEAGLRGEVAAQIGFSAAYRAGGLKRWLERRSPELAAVVEARLERLARSPRHQSASRWALFAQETLAAFGWPGSASRAPSQVSESWNRILADFASLGAVLGSIDLDRALTEIAAVAARTRLASPASLAGITVLERPEQLGPGYDAAWVAGMTDRAWPRPAQPNPLLPSSLQAAHRMPFATPADALSRCRAITARLIARVPEIVFSHPSIENDYAAAPSPLLGDLEPLDAGALPRPAVAYSPPARPRSLETVEDRPPPLAEPVVAGGAGTLAAQARCPLRALLESRLAARPLERVQHGITPRQRGLLAHRTLELLLADCAGRDQLAGYSEAELEARIGAAIDRAFSERLRTGDVASRAYAALERSRLASLAGALVRSDLARGEFTIEGLEVRHTAAIGGLKVDCRIDRIDRLADGRLAIIDYKTGQRATPADWLKPRLLEPQLPLYLHVVGADVGALAFASLQPGNVGYKGISDLDGAFAARMQRLPPGTDWPAQRQRWAEQLETLAAEFAAGDSRIFIAAFDEVAGPLAPLSRVYEQLALSRGNRAPERG